MQSCRKSITQKSKLMYKVKGDFTINSYFIFHVFVVNSCVRDVHEFFS